MSLGLKTAEYLLLIVDRPRFELGTEACKATVLANYTNSPFFSYPPEIRTPIQWLKTTCPAVRREGNLLVAGVGIEPT